MTQKQPPTRVIPCTRLPMTFTIRPQAPDTPTARGTCGHTVWQREQIMLDELVVSAPSIDRFGFWGKLFGRVRQDCFACRASADLEKTIVCPLCGGILFPGIPVCIFGYGGPTEGFPFWKYATRLTEDPASIVGCLNCLESGFFSGHWNGDGVLSPFATGTIAGDAFTTGTAIGVIVITH